MSGIFSKVENQSFTVDNLNISSHMNCRKRIIPRNHDTLMLPVSYAKWQGNRWYSPYEMSPQAFWESQQHQSWEDNGRQGNPRKQVCFRLGLLEVCWSWKIYVDHMQLIKRRTYLISIHRLHILHTQSQNTTSFPRKPLVGLVIVLGNNAQHSFDRFRCTFDRRNNFAIGKAGQRWHAFESRRKLETTSNSQMCSVWGHVTRRRNNVA